MLVKKKDRYLSRSECLNRARILVYQVMILTRPIIIKDDGTKVKPGILGDWQAFQSFGGDLLKAAKVTHAYCYQTANIFTKTKEDLDERNKYFKKAIEQCDSILRLLDLYID